MVSYNNLAELYVLWGKDDLAKKYRKLALETADAIDYKNNQENINKFIYRHHKF
ncbi:hypothetical protein [uncultured Anaerococcus sp.]|uniref:hypothetical protein n=1 Tax=Anaerococcus sp. AH8042_DFU013_CI05 TaxID=3385202 RepID=UPI0025FF1719|nr:hypothetical protein [uncultured Anaerococcus sp.]